MISVKRSIVKGGVKVYQRGVDVQRLQDGSRWLQEEMRCGRDDGDMYTHMFTTWAEIEEVVRTIHGFVGSCRISR